MTPLQIRTEIEALRQATKPEQRTSYEHAFLALALMVDQTTTEIDPLARQLMTAKQLDLINDLRSAVPSTAKRPDPNDEIARLRQLLRDLVDFDVGMPPELDQLDAEYGSRQIARMQQAWDAAIAEVGPRDQSRCEKGDVAKLEEARRPNRLEDIFTGTLALTASELAYLRYALAELYMHGGWCPKGENRRDFTKRVDEKLGSLKLDRMVTPDGSRLVSVEEHTALVAELNRGST